jgi:hypothetical protein
MKKQDHQGRAGPQHEPPLLTNTIFEIAVRGK